MRLRLQQFLPRGCWATALPVGLIAVLQLTPASHAVAQEPVPDSVPAASASYLAICGTPSTLASPSSEQVLEARRLFAAASQASILGDRATALNLMRDALTLDPTSTSTVYRLGRLLEDAGDEDQAITAYCRYLALSDEVPGSDEVQDRIDRLAGPVAVVAGEPSNVRGGREAEEDGGSAQVGPRAGRALVSGMLMPGMGHFYAGKPRTGIVVLGVAAGSAAAALLFQKVEVVCLGIAVDGECPQGLERSRTESRPLLIPGLALAAAVTVGGAIHAYLGARNSGAARLSASIGGEGAESIFSVEPSLEPAQRGIHAGLRVRF